ncbi:putative GNAT family acetyltransferase [Lipomyces kononenkoae]|uniref:GNAT family acetyltransferase n=1 Tax=Lipomyces kononenkoae TaxID=34357 RepID=A0ACC3T861_LIPKO
MATDFSSSPTFSIATERLHISYFQPDIPEHCNLLVRLLWPGIDTPAKAAEFIKNRIHADYRRNKYGQLLVSLKPHQNASLAESKLIGVVSLMRGQPPDGYLQPDIGYQIVAEENGKGYATEAAIGLMNYARRELGVDGVFGFCEKDDPRSRRVLEKIGLQYRGERKLRVFGGEECAVYALPGMDQDLRVYGIDD